MPREKKKPKKPNQQVNKSICCCWLTRLQPHLSSEGITVCCNFSPGLHPCTSPGVRGIISASESSEMAEHILSLASTRCTTQSSTWQSPPSEKAGNTPPGFPQLLYTPSCWSRVEVILKAEENVSLKYSCVNLAPAILLSVFTVN